MSKTAKRVQRRAWPIHGYVGPNGSGKSATMVYDTIPSLLAGRRVLSTVRILDFERPRDCEGCDSPGHERPVYRPLPKPKDLTMSEWVENVPEDERRELVGMDVHRHAHPLWTPFREWHQLLEAEHCDALLDEVTGIASSRDSMTLPSVVGNQLVQMRRDDVVIRWSAPAWARADKIVRECSQAVTYCVGHLPKRHEDSSRAWRNRRLSRVRTYDAQLFEDFTSGKREQLRPMIQGFLWLPGLGVFDAYDSFDAVLSIGTVTEGGTCIDCGGRRSRPACRCGTASGNDPATARPAGSPRSGVRDEPAPGRGRRIRTDHGTQSDDTPSRVLAPALHG